MPTLFGIIRDMAGAAIPGVRIAFRPETSRPAAMGADVSGRAQLDLTTGQRVHIVCDGTRWELF